MHSCNISGKKNIGHDGITLGKKGLELNQISCKKYRLYQSQQILKVYQYVIKGWIV